MAKNVSNKTIDNVTIRFAGDTADTATLNDKWEIEFFGKNESVDDAGMPYSIRMTRT